jgi:transcriptional regulator with XRE-family HTH domain
LPRFRAQSKRIQAERRAKRIGTDEAPVAEISAIGLARRLRDLLAERGWKPAQLANKAGLAASWVPAYLDARVARPRLETLRKMASAFEMDLADFLSGTPVEPLTVLLTAHEADVVRALAAVHRKDPDEVATEIVVAHLQSAYGSEISEVVRAIKSARQQLDEDRAMP